ncbi:MAG: hypothetical protein DRJ42_25185 [Deltaproteobacteria bacterium]|nr:MAG: hypothetical protein DRJ42_25185 [Deltaproteobacteria bacterium]
MVIAVGAVVSFSSPDDAAAQYSRAMELHLRSAGFSCQAIDTCSAGGTCDGGRACELFYPAISAEHRYACVNLGTTPVCCDDLGACPTRAGFDPPTCLHLSGLEASTLEGVCVYDINDWCPDAAMLTEEDVLQCFTHDGDRAETFGRGDCDEDGIRNEDEDAGQLCMVPPSDAGTPPSDAGPADASPPEDGAVDPDEDAATASDSGRPTPDTGARDRDTGPTRRGGGDGGDDFPSATSDFRGTGGCTCDASGRDGPGGELGGNFGLAFLVSLALMRRRRF